MNELVLIRKIIKKHKGCLKKIAKSAYIFGSTVENSLVQGESDIDMLIIPKKGVNLKKAYNALDSMVEELLERGFPVHIILYDPSRHPKNLLETAKRGIKAM